MLESSSACVGIFLFLHHNPFSGPQAKFLVTDIDKPRQDGSEPEDPTDPHEMLRKYWPGSRVRIVGPVPDRSDLTGYLATVTGANDEGQYQIVVLSPSEAPIETVFVDILHIEPILSRQHPKYRKGHAPSSFSSPNKLLRFEIGQKVQANMGRSGWLEGIIIDVWGEPGYIYSNCHYLLLRSNYHIS